MKLQSLLNDLQLFNREPNQTLLGYQVKCTLFTLENTKSKYLTTRKRKFSVLPLIQSENMQTEIKKEAVTSFRKEKKAGLTQDISTTYQKEWESSSPMKVSRQEL